MVRVNDISGDQRRRLSDQYETLLRSMLLLRGDRVSADQLGQMVDRAAATASPAEGRDSVPSGAMISRLQQILVETVDANAAGRPTNLYSAEAARQTRKGEGEWKGERRGFADALNLSPSSARFQEIVAAGRYSGLSVPVNGDAPLNITADHDWGSPNGLAKMRAYALQSGLPWAANNPELLRLGPAAIGALAEVHLRQETYKRLTGDASFKAKDVVTVARFAKEQHVDANKLGGAIADAEKPLTPQERDRLNKAIIPYMGDAKDPDKRDRAIKAFDDAAQAHPESRPAINRAKEALHLKEEKLDRESKVTSEKGSRAEQKSTRAIAENSQAIQKDSRASAEANRALSKESKASNVLAALDDVEPEPAASLNVEKTKRLGQSSNPQPGRPQPAKTAAPSPHKFG